MKRTPLRRYTPLRKRRPTLRRGELTFAEKEQLRTQVYLECRGFCQLMLHPQCRVSMPYEGDVLSRAHLVHKKAKRRFGWDRSNLTLGCYWCHIVAVHTKGAKIDGVP